VLRATLSPKFSPGLSNAKFFKEVSLSSISGLAL